MCVERKGPMVNQAQSDSMRDFAARQDREEGLLRCDRLKPSSFSGSAGTIRQQFVSNMAFPLEGRALMIYPNF